MDWYILNPGSNFFCLQNILKMYTKKNVSRIQYTLTHSVWHFSRIWDYKGIIRTRVLFEG